MATKKVFLKTFLVLDTLYIVYCMCTALLCIRVSSCKVIVSTVEPVKIFQFNTLFCTPDAAAVNAEEGLDVLDAFMANIKSGAMDSKTKMALKRRMFDLKQQQAKLQKLASVAKPADFKLSRCSIYTNVQRLFGFFGAEVRLFSRRFGVQLWL